MPGSLASSPVAGLRSRKPLVEIGAFLDRIFGGVLSPVCQALAQVVSQG